MKSLNKLATVAVCAAFVTACTTTPPRATYNSAKMSAVKSIAVVTPTKTYYHAVSASSGGGVIMAGGVLGTILATAALNTVTAGKSHSSFNDTVTEKLGDTGLNRKFVDALEAELKDAGYDVKEIELSGDDMPRVTVRRDGTQFLRGPIYEGADAIMVVQNTDGYYASGTFSLYTRDVGAYITLYKADTFDRIFSDQLRFNSGSSDSYRYATYLELNSDLPHAIQGVDEAAMALVPDFKADLLASLGVSAKTVRAATPPQPEQTVQTAQKADTVQKPDSAKAE